MATNLRLNGRNIRGTRSPAAPRPARLFELLCRRMAKRLQAMGLSNYRTGFRVALHEHVLSAPMGWKKPSVVFVNSMSDLFHEKVPLEFILKVFDIIRQTPHHQFQILTKRAERLSEITSFIDWPENVWMGVSVETAQYTHRIDHLKMTGAFIKFLSIEPMLGPIPDMDLTGIDWVIVGGESGPRSRRYTRNGLRMFETSVSKRECRSSSNNGAERIRKRLVNS